MDYSRKLGFSRLQNMFSDLFGLNRIMALCVSAFIVIAFFVSVYWFFHLAPPKTLTITSGPENSVFQRNAEKYRKILAKNGVDLKILPSQGSLENLQRLIDPAFHADIGFIQGGVARDAKIDGLVSLGSLYSSPLLVFYRNKTPSEYLSRFAGKRIVLGPAGSGAHLLAQTLLKANGIEAGGETTFLEEDADDAARSLLEGGADAVFLMGESAAPQTLRELLRAPGIRLYNFVQSDAYVRRMVYLNKLVLPRGAIDFGRNIPEQDVNLVAPTVELIARAGLHPALSDLLLEAAREIHGNAGLYRKQGEFPAPLEHEFPLSPDALRYYKSGKSFLYRTLPFWLASIANRVLVVFVPMIVIMIPVVKSIPALYRWKIRMGIYRWYRMLLALERDMLSQKSAEQRNGLLERLDHVEKGVNRMRVPASFADQFYVLRGHISFVRQRLTIE